jgi:hypothetical protein
MAHSIKVLSITMLFFTFIRCSNSVKDNSNPLQNKNDSTDVEIPEPESTPFQSFYNEPSPYELEAIVDSIVDVINIENKDISEFDELENDAAYGNNLKVYSLYQFVEGTRNRIILPIIQYTNKNKRYAAKLYNYIESPVDSIFRLIPSKNLFLLLGGCKGDSFYYMQHAYVIQLEKDSVNLEYPAFAKRPFLTFINGDFTYNQNRRILKFELWEESFNENLREVLYWHDHYGKFKADTLSAEWLENTISEEYNDREKRSFELKFNGTQFKEK